ncbi:MAG: orotidine 5'-phosphate decarboxylase [Candidatus Hodarchaeales archaeon]
MTGSFKEKLVQKSEKANSRLILALDVTTQMSTRSNRWKEKRKSLVHQAIRVIEATTPELAALKFNHQLVLPLGIFSEEMAQIMDAAADLPKIMDCKANDVGHTNRWIAQHYFDAGFDALIANPLVGFRGGIEEISHVAKERERGLILLCVMSHPGARFSFTRDFADENGSIPAYQLIARNAAQWGAHGLIVGGTYPELVQQVRSLIPREMLIISPGLGAQGGSGIGLRNAGTDYFIVGRSIFDAEKPHEAAKKFRNLSIEQ